MVKLPPVFMTAIDSRPCQCPKCNPKLHDELEYDAQKKTKDNYEAKLERKARDDLYATYKTKHEKKMEDEAKKAVVSRMRIKVRLKEVEKMKDDLVKEVIEELKIKMREELRVELEVEYVLKRWLVPSLLRPVAMPVTYFSII